MTSSIYNLTKGQIIICSIILNKTNISLSDYENVKNIIYNHLHVENLSPRQINDLYQLGYNDFGCSIKHHFKIKLKTLKEANINKVKQNNTFLTDEKRSYRKKCQFKFNVYDEPNILGFNLLTSNSFKRSDENVKNKTYLHRDHMVSISYGYENNIPPEHISHPANCEILTEKDNISKGNGCSISYDELLDRISNWDKELKSIKRNIIKRKISEDHKQKVSKTLSGRVYYNDGNKNYWIYPSNGELPKDNWILGKINLNTKVSGYPKTRKKRKFIPSKKIICPHCDKVGGAQVMHRWHFNNCPNKS